MSSIIEGYNYDIFISYRQKDNKYDGWVTTFVDNLRKELEATFKEDILIYFDENPHDGLLETHNVEKSLEGKLRCLVFIPVISQTYCDPKSFAWQNEFCEFNKLAKEDHFGRDIILPGGNVASRILPVKINDLDPEDEDLLENELGGVLRAVEFIYKEPGVNRPLTPDDDEKKNLSKTKYRNQINKVANAVKEIIKGLKFPGEKTQSERTKVTETEIGRRKIPWIKMTVATGIITAILIAGLLILPPVIKKLSGASSEIGKSIAVLPFEQWSSDEEFSHLGDAMANEINTQLVKIKDFRVISFTSCSRFRGSDRPSIAEMGKALGASIIVVGSLERQDQDVSIQVQAIRVSSDDHLWANEYKDKWTNIFNIRTNIAISIAKELKMVLTSEELINIDKKPTENIDAYNQYLIGNYLLSQLTPDSFQKAIDHYQKAIELDAEFAEAYCNLAHAYLQLMGWFSTQSIDYIPKVKSNLLKALEIDNKLGEAYFMLGDMNYLYEWDWDEAEKNFRKGLDLNPNFILGMIEYANFLTSMGRFDESKKIINRTIELDPLNPLNYNELTYTLWNAGELEQALEVRNTSLKLDPDHLQTLWGEIQYCTELGQYNKALSFWEKLKGNDEIIELPPYLLAFAGMLMESVGRREEAITYLNELNRRADEEGYKDTVPQALINIAIGENEKALELLEQAFENRNFAMVHMNVNKNFDPLRSYDRFQNIIKKMNFP